MPMTTSRKLIRSAPPTGKLGQPPFNPAPRTPPYVPFSLLHRPIQPAADRGCHARLAASLQTSPTACPPLTTGVTRRFPKAPNTFSERICWPAVAGKGLTRTRTPGELPRNARACTHTAIMHGERKSWLSPITCLPSYLGPQIALGNVGCSSASFAGHCRALRQLSAPESP